MLLAFVLASLVKTRLVINQSIQPNVNIFYDFSRYILISYNIMLLSEIRLLLSLKINKRYILFI